MAMTLDELLDQAKKMNEEEKIKELEDRKRRFEEILERRRKLRFWSNDDDSGVESTRLERPYEAPEEPDQEYEYDDDEYYDTELEEWIWDRDGGRTDDEWDR